MGVIKKILGLEKKPFPLGGREAVIPARCTATGGNFDILLGYEKGNLTMLSGKASSAHCGTARPASGSGLKTVDLSKGLFSSQLYHCPICGNKDIVRCGKCRRITCYDGKSSFRCAYCGNVGKVFGTMKSVDVYNPDGIKRDGLKPTAGMK